MKFTTRIPQLVRGQNAQRFIVGVGSALLVLCVAMLAFPVTSLTTSTEATAQRHNSDRYNNRRSRRHRARRNRSYRRRDDRRTVRETRPPNSDGLIYDDYPEWAARAFAPAWER